MSRKSLMMQGMKIYSKNLRKVKKIVTAANGTKMLGLILSNLRALHLPNIIIAICINYKVKWDTSREPRLSRPSKTLTKSHLQ